MAPSVLERLAAVHPDLEIWWDSSPLVFQAWVKKMVDDAPAKQKDELAEQLNRIYNVQAPAKSLIRGCTTNPPLSLTAVKSDPATWNEWIDNLIRSNPGLSQHEYFWLTYREVIRRGAEMMMPIWEASNGRYGYISGQLDPRLLTETEKMIEMAKEIRAIAPNVMQVPASTQGVQVVKVITSMAIPTNVTTCFTLPQIWAVANAAKEGVALAEKNKVDMSKWRAVITMMIGRLIENPVLDQQAARRGITLSWADKHWIGIYIFRKAFKLLKDNAMPSKMLACSMRDGPLVDGKYHFWDIEKIAGDIVYTMPPTCSSRSSKNAPISNSTKRFSTTMCQPKSCTKRARFPSSSRRGMKTEWRLINSTRILQRLQRPKHSRKHPSAWRHTGANGWRRWESGNCASCHPPSGGGEE